VFQQAYPACLHYNIMLPGVILGSLFGLITPGKNP
jgi:hypothetical protein